jgi:hypothetical protein
MDRLARMQQWAAGQYTSQYGNNPWIQAMMKFMRGLKGNYGSSASGWGGGMVNAGQQAQAPAPKPPAQQQQHGQPPGNSDGRQIGSPQSDNSIRPRPGIVRDPSAPGGDGVQYTMPAYGFGHDITTTRSGGQTSSGDDWRSRFAEEIGKLPITDKDHLGMPYKGGTGWDYPAMPSKRGNSSGYHSMPAGHDYGYHTMPVDFDSGFSIIMPANEPNNRTQIASMPAYSPRITNFGPENVMRVTSMPGVLGNVYPQWVTDYMMSHRSNSSGQRQGV